MSDTIESNMNIDMEGTRNERVAILLASYIIGFVTAYIAFGVMQLDTNVAMEQARTQNMASVITARNTTPTSKAFIAMDKEGLILVKDNERTLLSVTEKSDGFLTDGQHVAIADYSLSPDQGHVYFCELPSNDASSCRPYIYSIDDDVVYPVTVDGERVAFDADNQNVSWSESGELLIK